MTNVFLKEYSAVVMNYKIRHNKNQLVTRPVKYSLVWQDYFSIIICGGRKTEKHSLDMRAYMQG